MPECVQTCRRQVQATIPGKLVALGHVSSREELASIYASCDVFVHPNPAEPFGIAPLEAMASGLPLIAPDCGGVTSYANDCNAFLVPPTAQDFARTILRACDRDAENALKVQAAIAAANALAWPKVTEMFFSLYDQLYVLRSSRLPIASAQPEFVSLPAAHSRAGIIRSASNLAQASFVAVARAHRALRPTCHNQLHTELRSTQTR